MSATELHQKRNEGIRGQWYLRIEWLAVGICLVCLAITLASLMVAISANKNATEANIRTEVLLEENRKTNANFDLYKVYTGMLHADLKARGFEPPPLPEEK